MRNINRHRVILRSAGFWHSLASVCYAFTPDEFPTTYLCPFPGCCRLALEDFVAKLYWNHCDGMRGRREQAVVYSRIFNDINWNIVLLPVLRRAVRKYGPCGFDRGECLQCRSEKGHGERCLLSNTIDDIIAQYHAIISVSGGGNSSWWFGGVSRCK